MMNWVKLLLVLSGIIHLLPLQGLAGSEALTTLYGIESQDVATTLLLVHRAVLFGLLGTFLIISGFKAALQPLAIAAGLISTVSFIIICRVYTPLPDALNKVIIMDWIAIVALLLSTGLLLCKKAPHG